MALSADRMRGRLGLVGAVATLACLSHHVPAAAAPAPSEPVLAQCIAKEASGRAWLAQTLWGLRDQEGGWAGAEIANSNGTADLGPMQINSAWVPRIASLVRRSESDVRVWLTHDTCFNVRTASWLFQTGLGATKEYWRAVGLYHSPNAVRQRHYAQDVATKMMKRFGPKAFAARAKGDVASNSR